MNMKSIVAILFAAFLTAACSNTKEVEPLADLYRIMSTADFLSTSRTHFDGDLEGIPSWCSGRICGYVGGGGFSSPYAGRVSRQGIEHDRDVGGIRLFVSRTAGGDWTNYGAWMDSAAFFALRIPFEHGDGTPGNAAYAEAVGLGSEHPLPVEGTATWRGAMVGLDVTTYDRYSSEANLAATFGEQARAIDVHFTGIANVETGAGRDDISFEDVTLGLGGGTHFIAWQPGDVLYDTAPIYIDGRLHGPNHEEAAGVFGYNELVGAFGAKREQ